MRNFSSRKKVTRRACESLRVRWALYVAVCAAALTLTRPGRAQTRVEGFAVERLYASAPGAGWSVMDDLGMRGALGGVVALTGGYAYKPLVLRGGTGLESLDVVRHQSFADIGAAVTFARSRVYLNLTSPMVIKGQSGTVDGYELQAPSVSLRQIPDLVSDLRVGWDLRVLGQSDSPLRLGLGSQLMIPNGDRHDYDTDGRLRAMFRGLFAANWAHMRLSAQLGVHVRTLDDAPVPGAPRGSEALFGIALGPRFALTSDRSVIGVVGPEVFGVTALGAPFGRATTALEGLMTARVEGTRTKGSQLRLRVSLGRGLHSQFGAPEGRVVVGLEVFDSGK